MRVWASLQGARDSGHVDPQNFHGGCWLVLLREALPSSTRTLESVPFGGVKQEPALMGIEVCRDVQRELLGPWQAAKPEAGRKLHYGAVLHALVQHSRAVFGEEWPELLIITCISACERQDLLALQQGAKYVVGVLCTETHWACCFAQKGCPQVLLADSLEEPGILEAARAFLLHLADRWPEQYHIEAMPVLRQSDDWSCGHRVVLTSAAVMNAWVEEEEWPVRVAMSTCTNAKIQAYCERGHAEGHGQTPAPSKAASIPTPSRSLPTPSPAAFSMPIKNEVVVPASSSPPTPSPAAVSKHIKQEVVVLKPIKKEVVVPASSSLPTPSPGALSEHIKNEAVVQAPIKKEVVVQQAPEPTTPKAKKPKVSPPLLDDDREALHAKQPPPKRRKLTEAQKRQEWRDAGLELAKKKRHPIPFRVFEAAPGDEGRLDFWPLA